MKVIHVNSLVLLFVFSGNVHGIIKNDAKKRIHEEERRGTGELLNEVEPDQATYVSFKRDAWAVGLNLKGQVNDCHHCQPDMHEGDNYDDQGQHGYRLSAPDNLGYPPSSDGQYAINTIKINEPGHGFRYSSGGNGFNYEYDGGGLGNLGYSGGGNFGHIGGGVGNIGHGGSGIEAFGHGTGTGSYGYNNGEIGNYGFSGGGNDYGHSSGVFGGLKSLIHKKLSLKKIILPIAAIALLGAAAAMTTNPVLLQLGTISGRKRRSISEKLERHSFPQNPFVRPSRV